MELSGSHPHFSRDIHFEIPLISYFVYFDLCEWCLREPQAPGFTPAVVFGG